MRATTQLVLVLMGGGSMAAGTAMSMQSSRACADARERRDPNAEQICRSWTNGWHGGAAHGWFGGGHAAGFGGGTLASTSRIARGGFGFTGMHFGGGHG